MEKRIAVFGTDAVAIKVIGQLRDAKHEVIAIGDGQSNCWTEKLDMQFDLVTKSKSSTLEAFDEALRGLIKRIGAIDTVIYAPRYICSDTDLKLGDSMASSALEQALRLWITYPRHIAGVCYQELRAIDFLMLNAVCKENSALWTIKRSGLEILSILATNNPNMRIRAHFTNINELVAQARSVITGANQLNEKDLRDYVLGEEARKVVTSLR